jgi:hypothetical protein
MAWHDAAMTRIGQWWLRAKRAGYAFAQGAALHGKPPERHCVREAKRCLAWGILLPAGILAATAINPWFLAFALAYPLQVVRLAMRSELPRRKAWWHALFLVLGRFPEGMGWLGFHVSSIFAKRSTLIEYK